MPWRRSALPLFLVGGLVCAGCCTPASRRRPAGDRASAGRRAGERDDPRVCRRRRTRQPCGDRHARSAAQSARVRGRDDGPARVRGAGARRGRHRAPIRSRCSTRSRRCGRRRATRSIAATRRRPLPAADRAHVPTATDQATAIRDGIRSVWICTRRRSVSRASEPRHERDDADRGEDRERRLGRGAKPRLPVRDRDADRHARSPAPAAPTARAALRRSHITTAPPIAAISVG